MTNSRWEWKTVNLINIQAKVCFKNGLMSEVWCMKKCWNSSTWKRRKSNILCNFPIIFPVLYSCWKNAKKKKWQTFFFFFSFFSIKYQISWISYLMNISDIDSRHMTWTKLFQIFIIFQQNCFTNVRTGVLKIKTYFNPEIKYVYYRRAVEV